MWGFQVPSNKKMSDLSICKACFEQLLRTLEVGGTILNPKLEKQTVVAWKMLSTNSCKVTF